MRRIFDGFERRFIDMPIRGRRLLLRSAEFARETDGAHDAERVFLETLFRVSDRPDDLLFDIGQTVEWIDDGNFGDGGRSGFLG